MTTCEHLACIIPANLVFADVEVVKGEHDYSGWAVTYRGVYIGGVRDDGYRHYEGHWIEKWSVFAGGNSVANNIETKIQAVGKLMDHVTWASFHWRMALHV